ncbi:MAG: succinate dehydrogenase cytochrome b subunit, partial [Muribaculaceae bacterium]|nr:succinate dehydrogenase cytochrome b subunit [Muribaculaceae bacterium]
FVTFHCLMNTIAICWPNAYNTICMFLGANWYALVASAGLAVFILIHIIDAFVLTVQNRRARGSERYLISKTPKGVEWSSKNMLVLGIVILAFLVVHLIQFWAKMQLQEIRGIEGAIPATAGTLFLQEAFGNNWTWIVYIVGFIALWFHMNHGFWSMFQSVGWDSTVWIPRLKCIAAWWTSIVVALFIAQCIVFTVKAHQGYYLTDENLRTQYKVMVSPAFDDFFGAGVSQQIAAMPFEQYEEAVRGQYGQMSNPQAQVYFAQDPKFPAMLEFLEHQVALLDYLHSKDEAQPVEEISIEAVQGGQDEATPAQHQH